MDSVSVADVPADQAALGSLLPGRSDRQRIRAFLRNPIAVGAAVFLLVVVAFAVAPAVFAPRDPNAVSLLERFQSPNATHWLGTDELGRDQLSRVIYGARVSMLAGVEGLVIALVLGVPLGTIAAYRQGRLEAFLDWLNDGFQSIPALLLAITIVAVLGPGLTNVMIGVGVSFIPRFYRMARAATHAIREETFIEASRSLGCSDLLILRRHVLPNISAIIVVQSSLAFANMVLAEATLSFLGLGVSPPTSSWGQMLQSASGQIFEANYLSWGPGVMLFLTVLALQLASDALQGAFGARPVDDSEVYA